MNRFFLSIAYLGTRYAGWQRQPNALSVEEEIETWLSRLYGQEVDIFGSGRTDTGVHATGQVAHVDLPDTPMTAQLLEKLNRVLPEDIVINSITPVRPDAHARYDGIARKYCYRLHFHKDPFLQQTSTRLWQEPDMERMQQASPALLGEKSFRGLSKMVPKEKHYLCRVTEAYWVQTERGLEFHIKANRFLKGMVRATVGALLRIGLHEQPVEWLGDIIAREDAVLGAALAPPQGLYLESVEYRPEIYLL